jgi:hypothetical protein
MIFRRLSNARTMNSFPFLLNKLTEKLKDIIELDVVVVSDHYDIKKVPEKCKHLIPIIFDYSFLKTNDTFESNGIKVRIVEKLLGTTYDIERSFLEKIYSCDYIIGNMSCLPVVLAKGMNSKIQNLSRNIVPNIRTIEDMEELLKNPTQKTKSLVKYS